MPLQMASLNLAARTEIAFECTCSKRVAIMYHVLRRAKHLREPGLICVHSYLLLVLAQLYGAGTWCLTTSGPTCPCPIRYSRASTVGRRGRPSPHAGNFVRFLHPGLGASWAGLIRYQTYIRDRRLRLGSNLHHIRTGGITPYIFAPCWLLRVRVGVGLEL